MKAFISSKVVIVNAQDWICGVEKHQFVPLSRVRYRAILATEVTTIVRRYTIIGALSSPLVTRVISSRTM